jgi:hypothetical protein
MPTSDAWKSSKVPEGLGQKGVKGIKYHQNQRIRKYFSTVCQNRCVPPGSAWFARQAMELDPANDITVETQPFI